MKHVRNLVQCRQNLCMKKKKVSTTKDQRSPRNVFSKRGKRIVKLKRLTKRNKEDRNTVYCRLFQTWNTLSVIKRFGSFSLYFTNSVTLKRKANCYWGSASVIEVRSVLFPFCYWLLLNEMSNPSTLLKSQKIFDLNAPNS